jgi:GGDEF domain-containing protein
MSSRGPKAPYLEVSNTTALWPPASACGDWSPPNRARKLSLDLSVTISIGLAMVRPGEDARVALARADQSLYRPEEEGRDRVDAVDEDRP